MRGVWAWQRPGRGDAGLGCVPSQAAMSESAAEAQGDESPAARSETGTSHELLQRLRELEVRGGAGPPGGSGRCQRAAGATICPQLVPRSQQPWGHGGDSSHLLTVPPLLGWGSWGQPFFAAPTAHQAEEGSLGATGRGHQEPRPLGSVP